MRRAIMGNEPRESSSTGRGATLIRHRPLFRFSKSAGAAARSSSRRPPSQDVSGVLEIDLVQDGLRQTDAVDLPAALDGGRALELPVAGLEVPPRRLEEPLLV